MEIKDDKHILNEEEYIRLGTGLDSMDADLEWMKVKLKEGKLTLKDLDGVKGRVQSALKVIGWIE